MGSRPIVLLVEADHAQETLTCQAIVKSEIDCGVRIARDGADACQTLFDSDDPSPTLILLTLDLPKMNGFDLLARIRATESTHRLPVVVYSRSGNQADVDRCFDLHANSFVLMDDDLELNETRFRLLLYYWIAVNKNGNA